MTGGYDYFYTLQEICVLLNLLPNTFRQIIREYSDIIAPREQIRKGRPVMGLPRADFEVLRQIVELRSRGVSPEEIRRLAGLAGAAAPVYSGLAPGESIGVPPGGSGDVRPGRPEDVPPGENQGASRIYDDASDDPAAGEDTSLPGVRISTESWPIPARPGEEGRPPDRASEAEVGPPGTLVVEVGAVGSGTAEAEVATAKAATGESSPVPFLDALAGPDPSEPVLERALLAEIAALREELQKMDEHRREERDRLLTALMRTQHELQSLRYEVGVTLSRRDRKRKKGFWAWLLDL